MNTMEKKVKENPVKLRLLEPVRVKDMDVSSLLRAIDEADEIRRRMARQSMTASKK